MSKKSITTIPIPKPPNRCLHCGHDISPDATECPQCGSPVEVPQPAPSTVALTFERVTRDIERARKLVFPATANAVLKLVASDDYVSLALDNPVVVGRTLHASLEETLDLSEFNAREYGVSRRHCRLQRRGQFLVVTDLGSTNGTQVNGMLLAPYQDRTLAHGDQLLLGSFEILVFFSTNEAE